MTGRILTFYSYKGGVGRTMTAANVAWILASNGKRVLGVDWDLEAPGFHRYFQPFIEDATLESSDGLVDMILAYQTMVMTPLQPGEEDWLEQCADISRYAISLDWEFPGEGTLDLMTAGRQDGNYRETVWRLDWRALYESINVGAFLNLVVQRMRADYDYVLIDSSAGLNHTAAICTTQLPDRLVICTTLDGRGLDGSVEVGMNAKKQRPDLKIYPVLSRLDLTAELEAFTRRLEVAWKQLRPLMGHLKPEKMEEYRKAVRIPYVPFYSFGERLAVFDSKPEVRDPIVLPIERLTSFLSDNAVSRAAPIPAETREAVEAWSTDQSPLERTKLPSPQVRIFISYAHIDKRYMSQKSLLGFLEGLKGEDEVVFWWDEEIVTGQKWDEEIRERIRGTDIALVLVSQYFLNSPYCQKTEIRNFLHECEDRGLVIFPVILSACEWKAHRWLEQRHLLPKEGQNIEEHYSSPGKRKALFLDIYRDLGKQIAEKQAAKIAVTE